MELIKKEGAIERLMEILLERQKLWEEASKIIPTLLIDEFSILVENIGIQNLKSDLLNILFKAGQR